MVEILAGALTEGGVSNSEESRSRPFFGGNGIFIMAIDIGQITDLSGFKKRVDGLLRTVKNSPKAQKATYEIIIPGERERRIKEKLLREGIFVEDKTWSQLATLAKELKIKLPV